jgi:hypothetical protein
MILKAAKSIIFVHYFNLSRPNNFRSARIRSISSWTNAIPIENKSGWHDQRVVEFYIKTTLATGLIDETGLPIVRLSNGFQREANEMSLGKKIFEAAQIRVPTPVMRSEFEHWSRPEDLTALNRDLKNSPRKKNIDYLQRSAFCFY